jgi:hypothetical protein
MFTHEANTHSVTSLHFSFRGFITRNLPYLVMLMLSVFGVAYTNFARHAMTNFWIVLAPLFGLICVASRWRHVEGGNPRLSLIGHQAVHWLAVVIAMYLVFVADVQQMMSDDATALMVLTILALGTFTAGIQISSWRLCMVGTVLALGVPTIAWFEERTLLFTLLGLVLATAAALLFILDRRSAKLAAG